MEKICEIGMFCVNTKHESMRASVLIFHLVPTFTPLHHKSHE